MSYNGYRSWNQWNVSLWIGNDEGLCGMAKQCICGARRTSWARNGYSPRDAAVFLFMETIHECGVFKTPDGAVYNETSVRVAMRGM